MYICDWQKSSSRSICTFVYEINSDDKRDLIYNWVFKSNDCRDESVRTECSYSEMLTMKAASVKGGFKGTA